MQLFTSGRQRNSMCQSRCRTLSPELIQPRIRQPPMSMRLCRVSSPLRTFTHELTLKMKQESVHMEFFHTNRIKRRTRWPFGKVLTPRRRINARVRTAFRRKLANRTRIEPRHSLGQCSSTWHMKRSLATPVRPHRNAHEITIRPGTAWCGEGSQRGWKKRR